jgi:hypothetical protein
MKPYYEKTITDAVAMATWRKHAGVTLPKIGTLYRVPDYMHGGLARWVLWAIPPGDFLKAVLSNDLKGAAQRADENNQRCLFDWCVVLYNALPGNCHGSPLDIEAWRGTLGRCDDCGAPLDIEGDEGSNRVDTDSGEAICELCANHRADQKYAAQVMQQ